MKGRMYEQIGSAVCMCVTCVYVCRLQEKRQEVGVGEAGRSSVSSAWDLSALRGVVMLCTVQSRPVPVGAIKSPSGGCCSSPVRYEGREDTEKGKGADQIERPSVRVSLAGVDIASNKNKTKTSS